MNVGERFIFVCKICIIYAKRSWTGIITRINRRCLNTFRFYIISIGGIIMQVVKNYYHVRRTNSERLLSRVFAHPHDNNTYYDMQCEIGNTKSAGGITYAF